ncbi:MAG: cupredoxin family protein [Alphaproteobacteria bacterium]|nr:cupredoxin family protein [Alphaproteobacteria bacterium]
MRVPSAHKLIRVSVLTATLALILSSGAYAAGQHGGGHGHGPNIGKPGEASQVTRTIEMVMTDNRFTPEKITIKKGETIRFKVRNNGQIVHEFNIGTAAMHAAHQKEMAMMVEHGVLEIDKINRQKMNMDMGGGHVMKHDDPNSVLLEPGKSAEVIWTFSSDAKLEFACNVPGHYDAGMVGKIDIE